MLSLTCCITDTDIIVANSYEPPRLKLLMKARSHLHCWGHFHHLRVFMVPASTRHLSGEAKIQLVLAAITVVSFSSL